MSEEVKTLLSLIGCWQLGAWFGNFLSWLRERVRVWREKRELCQRSREIQDAIDWFNRNQRD